MRYFAICVISLTLLVLSQKVMVTKLSKLIMHVLQGLFNNIPLPFPALLSPQLCRNSVHSTWKQCWSYFTFHWKENMVWNHVALAILFPLYCFFPLSNRSNRLRKPAFSLEDKLIHCNPQGKSLESTNLSASFIASFILLKASSLIFSHQRHLTELGMFVGVNFMNNTS